ncbi:MMPL family transporter [Cryobacterium psychrophilum]|uniref:MMPL family transporter n=1 Tax=Cryobacterium psychrophilum TaxID=41988 RepID=A0A4Y8KS60_9MICO|nr:MMPL family transporter [Cryobacterium psychrophilum]TDW28810.1 RND superfamily putative drug exporter [Cryobacterium psychrophilum]TFD82454.1 MMPL family transporter [Cryobacterium psychrophilum]
MLRTLGVFVARHRLSSLLIWVLLIGASVATALFGVTGESLFQRLSSGGPSVEGEASQAAELLQDPAAEDTESLSLLVHGVDLSAPELAGLLSEATRDLTELDGVTSVVNPLTIPPLPDGQPNPAAAPLLAPDGTGLLLNVEMATTGADLNPEILAGVEDRLDTAAGEIRQLEPDAVAEVGGTPLLVESLVAVAEADLQKGELIALPIALVVMLIIFGGFLAAGIPLIGALASIAGALGALFAFSHFMEIDTTVLNVITVIGLGLSIDYGLLIVSRFREEFRLLVAQVGEDQTRTERHELMLQAVGVTVDTAGRTVLYSGLTFAIATVGLLVFEPTIIRAISIGAVSVVLIAILTALVLVPALLGYFGERLLKAGVLTRIPGLGALLTRFGDVAPPEGVFSRLTRLVQRAPTLVALGGVVLLLLLGSPVLNMNVSSGGAGSIPKASTQYEFVTGLTDHFPLATAPLVQLVADSDEASAAAWAEEVASLPNVTGTTPPVEVNGYWVSRVGVDQNEGPSVVRDIRADRPLLDNWVGGTDAASVDYTDSLLRGAPWAALIIGGATFALLFLMTGSVVIPLTALLVSVISLGASVGILVWGFQEGNLAGLLDFDAATIAGVDPLVLTLVLTFGFGLAMDYEMFLLARIKEHHEQGESTRRSIETGLQSSGRIISSAALIIVIVFAGFATGDLLQMKQIGVALAVAVLLDATLVRTIVVPAVMTSLDRSLWWAPKWMHPIHSRFGMRE